MAVGEGDPNLWDLDPRIYLALRDALDENHAYEELFRVMHPVYSKGLWPLLEIRSQKYGSTPAGVLLKCLGDKGVCVSLLAKWLEELGLERILTLIRKDEILIIIEQPLPFQNIVAGSTLRLWCRATSFPSPCYQWFRNGKELLLQQEPELIIQHVEVDDSGIYICRVHKFNSETNDISHDFSSHCIVKVMPQEYEMPYDNDKHEEKKENMYYSTENSLVTKNTQLNRRKRKNNPAKNKGSIEIVKQPVCPAQVPYGTSLTLSCAAWSSLPLSYQWVCDGWEIPDANSPNLPLENIMPDLQNGKTRWRYLCRIYNKLDTYLTDSVTVELMPSDGDNNAVEKIAFLIACDEYENTDCLLSPPNDVKILADLLYEMDFKIFALRNLTRQQMKNALSFLCRLVRPGTYVLVYYAGHGFEFYKDLHLQPVDCGSKPCPQDSLSADYILECIQEREPALKVLLLDTCRTILPNHSQISPPKKIPVPKDSGNTVWGYATSYSYPSFENDAEPNSCFVKFLKQYLQHKIKVQDILYKVQQNPNIQVPYVGSSLREHRTLQDPVTDPDDSVFDEKIPWADIGSTVFDDREYPIKKLDIVIVLQFCHHKDVFCNGMDVNIYLEIGRNADLHIINAMKFDLDFKSDEINKIMKKLDHQPENKIGKTCLQAVYEIQRLQSIEESLSGTLSYKLGPLDLKETFDLGLHPVLELELNREIQDSR